MSWMSEEEKQIQSKMMEMIEEFTEWDVETYEDSGVLTYNAGLEVSTEDGHGFQITIVQAW